MLCGLPERDVTHSPNLNFFTLGINPTSTNTAATITAHSLICRTFSLNVVCVAAATVASASITIRYPDILFPSANQIINNIIGA